MPMLAPGALAPEFALPDAHERVRELSAALRDGPVLATFLKIHCATSRTLVPYLERLHRALRDTPAHVWGIALDPPDEVRSFARRHGATFPMLVDFDAYVVSRAYDPESTPTLFLIEPGGTVAYVSSGFRTADLNAIATRLADLVGQQVVALVSSDYGAPNVQAG